MLTKSFYTVMLGLFLASCNQKKEAVLAPEYLYNGGNEQVISSLINNKKGTIAIIYGNDLALRSSRDSLRKHIAGERYVMVTWKQRPMPHWYGTNMNGGIIAVETVKVSQGPKGDVFFDYQLAPGQGTQFVSQDINKDTRIKLIIGPPAAVFP